MKYTCACLVRFLRMKDALELVPVEYEKAYRWFQDNEENSVRCLPMGSHIPDGFKHPLARQAGIYTPSYSKLPSKGLRKNGQTARPYALSIHSEGQVHYADRNVIAREDGTWILDYKAQRSREGTALYQHYNDGLMNCMEDGVPVGVMVKQSTGYTVLGLAYVEKYNRIMDMFTLHGPVNVMTEKKGAFDIWQSMEGVAAKDPTEPIWCGTDERKLARYERVVREKQDTFRNEVLKAYNGSCALTDIAIPEVLQAAHIDSYRGAYTQVVGNGILLRSDIHLLYDAQLLAILPESHIIEVSDRLIGTPYEKLAKEIVCGKRRRIRIPINPCDAPREDLLESHYREFCVANNLAC